MRCPACDQALRPLKTGAVLLDVCHECGGIWFDHQELEKVNADYPNPAHTVANFVYNPHTRVDENRDRPCPRCEDVMLEKKLYNLGSGVIMDSCPECKGTWLDRGELEKIRESMHPHSPQARARTKPVAGQDVAISFDVLQQVQSLQRTSPPRS